MTLCPWCDSKKFLPDALPMKKDDLGNVLAWKNTCANTQCNKTSVFDDRDGNQYKVREWQSLQSQQTTAE